MSANSDFVHALRGKYVADGILHCNVVDLTAAQIKTLRARPVNIVPAPGDDYVLLLDSVTLILFAGSEVLSESSDNLVVQYDGGQDATGAIETTGFIDQSADTVAHVPAADIAAVALADVENDALELFNTGDGEFGGNASNDAALRVVVRYWVARVA